MRIFIKTAIVASLAWTAIGLEQSFVKSQSEYNAYNDALKSCRYHESPRACLRSVNEGHEDNSSHNFDPLESHIITAPYIWIITIALVYGGRYVAQEIK